MGDPNVRIMHCQDSHVCFVQVLQGTWRTIAGPMTHTEARTCALKLAEGDWDNWKDCLVGSFEVLEEFTAPA
jgi:hypothetical protein